VLLGCGADADPPDADVAADGPRVESLTPDFGDFVSPDAEIEVLAEGHGWTEGPVWVPELEGLLYSDIPANAIYLYREGIGSEPWLEPTDEDPSGSGASNGLILGDGGALLLAQHGDRRLARLDAPWDAPRPVYAALAERFEGARFNSPNDLVQGPAGDLYFTDPPYGLAAGDDDPAKELAVSGVYRRTPAGEIRLVDDRMARPNGIVLSPDGRTLYVASSDPGEPFVYAYAVDPDGKVGARRVFAETMGDGMTVDRAGNVWVAEPTQGVFVFDPDGRHLGSILTGQRTSNVAWGDDGSTLYVTADSYLMRVRVGAVGVGF
jgi:gluconolactonase